MVAMKINVCSVTEICRRCAISVTVGLTPFSEEEGVGNLKYNISIGIIFFYIFLEKKEGKITKSQKYKFHIVNVSSNVPTSSKCA